METKYLRGLWSIEVAWYELLRWDRCKAINIAEYLYKDQGSFCDMQKQENTKVKCKFLVSLFVEYYFMSKQQEHVNT